MARQKNARRKDGRIARQVYIGRGEDGKRKYKTIYGYTQKEVDEAVLNVKLALKKGIDVAAENDSFAEWATRLLKIKKLEVSASQYGVIASAIDHLNKYLQGRSISKIRTADIQDVIDDLAYKNPNTGKPAAKRTLVMIRSVAGQTFRLAIDNRVMDYNPAPAVKIPKTAPQDHRRALTEEEQQWILDTPHRVQRAAMIMMYAGLRRGELIPLQWADINLKDKTITVNKSVEMVDGKSKKKMGAKTESGTRVVDIPTRLVDFLTFEKRKDGITDETENKLVFACRDGSMLSSSAWRSLWESYLRDLNIKYGDFDGWMKKNNKKKPPKSKFDPAGVPMVIPRFTAHWLRHTFATLLYMAGVDVLTAKDQLGHKDIQTTLEIYTHLDKVYKRKSMNKMDAYLDGTAKTDASQMQVIQTK